MRPGNKYYHITHWRIQDLTLGGAWTLSTGGRKSLKVLKVEVKVILKRVLVLFLLHLCLKLVASEASEEKKREKLAFWALKNHRSAAVRGGARVRPPLDPLVI